MASSGGAALRAAGLGHKGEFFGFVAGQARLFSPSALPTGAASTANLPFHISPEHLDVLMRSSNAPVACSNSR